MVPTMEVNEELALFEDIDFVGTSTVNDRSLAETCSGEPTQMKATNKWKKPKV